MIAPTYTITTAIVNFVNSVGEECRNLNYFTNLIIERESIIDELLSSRSSLIFIKLKDKSTFYITIYQ
jgi:hypothetical protein